MQKTDKSNVVVNRFILFPPFCECKSLFYLLQPRFNLNHVI